MVVYFFFLHLYLALDERFSSSILTTINGTFGYIHSFRFRRQMHHLSNKPIRSSLTHLCVIDFCTFEMMWIQLLRTGKIKSPKANRQQCENEQRRFEKKMKKNVWSNQIWKAVNWWRWSRHVYIKPMCQFATIFFSFSSLGSIDRLLIRIAFRFQLKFSSFCVRLNKTKANSSFLNAACVLHQWT